MHVYVFINGNPSSYNPRIMYLRLRAMWMKNQKVSVYENPTISK